MRLLTLSTRPDPSIHCVYVCILQIFAAAEKSIRSKEPMEQASQMRSRRGIEDHFTIIYSNKHAEVSKHPTTSSQDLTRINLL